MADNGTLGNARQKLWQVYPNWLMIRKNEIGCLFNTAKNTQECVKMCFLFLLNDYSYELRLKVTAIKCIDYPTQEIKVSIDAQKIMVNR